jgi:hypothetical protein
MREARNQQLAELAALTRIDSDGFTILGRWKKGTTMVGELIEVSWVPPNHLTGAPGFIKLFRDMEKSKKLVRHQDLPFYVDVFQPLSVMAVAEVLLDIDRVYGDFPEVGDDPDRFLFPEVKIKNGKAWPTKRDLR